MVFGVDGVRRVAGRIGLRRVLIGGLAGIVAVGGAAGVLFSASRLGARAQTPPGYTLSGYDTSGLPGFRLSVQQALTAPGSADVATVYGSPASPTATAPSARITALARALENNPDRIYQFVYNSILFEPQFGLHKGADGVLLDGSGGSFDQSQLMAELLRASGYQARFVLGQVNLSGGDAKSILRVDNAKQACLLLAAAGTPATVNGAIDCGAMSGDVSTVVMLHLWVEANIGGTWYAFDPSLKTNTKVAGIDLWDAAGASSAASAWSNISSGVSVSGGDLTGLNRVSIQNKMSTYADTLQDELIADHSGKTLRQLTGGWEINRTEATPRVAATPYQASVSTRWTGDVPAPYRATVRLQTAGFDHTFDLPSIYGWRTQAQLQVRTLKVAVRNREHEDVAATAYFVGNFGTAECDNVSVICGTSPTQAAFDAQARRLDITINHPYAGRRSGVNPTDSQPWAAGTFADETVAKHLEIGKRADLLIRTAGGGGARKAAWAAANDPIQGHRIVPSGDDYNNCYARDDNTPIADGECDGKNAEDWRYWVQDTLSNVPSGFRLFPRGEVAVAEMGTKKDGLLNTWTDLFDKTVRMMEPLSGARIFHQHSVGLAITPSATENVLDIDTSVGIAAGGTDQPHHILSALASLAVTEEALAIGQMATERPMFQGSSTQTTAARRLGGSTSLKVLSTVGSTAALPSDVSADTKARIEAYLTRGFTVASSTVAGGNAFLARRNDGSEEAWILRSHRMGQNPDVDSHPYFLKGAESEKPNPLDFLGSAEARRLAANVAGSHLGAVDLRTGSLSFGEGTELSMGQGEFPYLLTFSRSYVSTGPIESDTGLGMGWTHNWESSVSHSTDVGALMPDAETVTAAPMLVAALTALQAGRANAIEASVVSGVALDWLQEQIAANVVTVSGGGRTGRFVRLVDGTWRNPASPTESIAPATEPFIGAYTTELNWTQADRSVMTFRNIPNPHSGTTPLGRSGVATSWTFPSGVIITLTYSGQDSSNRPMLTTVANNVGATLSFSYSKSSSWGDTQACNTSASQMYPNFQPGYREAVQACYEDARKGGRLIRVVAGADEINFSHNYICPQFVNFCAFQLAGASRPGMRNRLYTYGTPTGAVAGYATALDYQQVLIQVDDDGVATPRARFDWRAVAGQVAPYIAESFDAENRKTIYYPSNFTYSAAKDAENGVVRQNYDEDGRLIASADALGRTSRARYDGPGRTIEIRTPWGDTTNFTFDARGNLTKRRQTPITNCASGLTAEQVAWWCQTIEIDAEYDLLWNKPTKIVLPATAADGYVDRPEWTLRYNSQGLVDMMTGPTVADGAAGNANARAIWRTWFDSLGRPIKTQDPTGVEVATTYGGSGNPAFCLTRAVQGSQIAGGAITTDFTCDTVGNVLTTTTGGATTTTEYDNLRRKWRETGPSGTNIKTQWIYDLNGDQVQVQRWDANAAVWRNTTTTYSATRKALTVTDPSGDVSRTCYDLVDRAVMTIDPELRATRTVYNAAGQPTEVHRFQRASAGTCAAVTQLPAGVGFTETRWRRIEYNAGGLQSAEIDANGNRTEQVYDGLGRAARTVYANTLQEWSAMDERGQVVTRKQPGSHRVSLFYDAMGRDFHVREYADSEKAYKWTGRNSRASYDLAGRPVWRDVSNQTTTTTTFDNSLRRDVRNYVYNDPLRRLTAEQWQPEGVGVISYTTGYGYADGRGNRTSITQPGGWTITYGFDLANRVQTVSFPGASGTQTVTFTHDSLGRRTGVDRPGAAADTSYSYDVDNDLTGLTHAFVAGTGPGSTSYAYGRDAAGKVTSIGLNQPTFEWMPTLAYARTYGPASNMNRIASVSDAVESRALTWNGDGDLSQEVRTPVGGGAPVTWTYHYTYGHRLAVVTTNAAVSPLTAAYSYDSDDRRTKKVVNGVTTRTMWSGADELAEYDVNGDLIRRFIPDGSGAMDVRLATVTPSGVVYWHHTDHQGSVIATSDSAGKTVGTATYSPHGEGAPPAQSPFGYTGRQYDPETGLYYYRARYYSPYLGQFLTMDPVGTKDDPNLYMYVGLDPANATDPSGMCTLYCPFDESDPASISDWFQNASMGSRVLYYIFNGRPSIDITTYAFGSITAVPGFGAGAQIGTYEYSHNGVRMETGIVIIGEVLFGFEIDIGASASIRYGKPEDGIQFTWSVAVGAAGVSGGSKGADTVEGSVSAPIPFKAGATLGGAIVQHIPVDVSPAGEENVEERQERSANCPPSRMLQGCGME